jgi:uncharacterized protein
MRATIRAILALALLGLLAGAGAAQGPAEMRLFRIGTGGPSGVYYAIGSILADALSYPPGTPPCRPDEAGCGIPGMIAVAQSTAGSVANIEALRTGRVESAFAQADIAYAAIKAEGNFAEASPAEELRAIASLYPETLHLVVHPQSGITEIAELRGKRVAVDERGSGTLVEVQLVLAAVGLSEADIEPVYVKHGPALAMMREDELDAMFVVGGDPMPPVMEAVRQLGAALVPLDGPTIEALLEEKPFLVPAVIAEGTYPGLPDIATIAVRAEWLVSAELDEETAYGLTRVLFDPVTQARLTESHAQGRRISLSTALTGLAAPLHPGAERYYRDEGVIRVD